MPRRPPSHIDAELTGRLAAIEIARAQLFDVDSDRKKRIDGLIDYFGTPHSAVARDRIGRPPAAQIIALADLGDPSCMASRGGHCLDAQHSGVRNFEQV
jgi:hypothetical protein